MFDIVLLAVAGFVAGVLNAVAGGGTFLSLPALVFVGIPPVSANATATLSALPGYISSAWAFRSDMKSEGSLGLKAIFGLTAIGSVVGAGLLIVTPGDVFMWIVPWLLLAATIMFAAGPALLKALQRGGARQAGVIMSAAAFLAVATYGGYFNGGLGIILLAALGLLGYENLNGMNGLKCALSAILSIISSAAFIVAGLIAWEQALTMAVFAAIGGHIGARQSQKVRNPNHLRALVTIIGAVMTIAFFVF